MSTGALNNYNVIKLRMFAFMQHSLQGSAAWTFNCSRSKFKPSPGLDKRKTKRYSMTFVHAINVTEGIISYVVMKKRFYNHSLAIRPSSFGNFFCKSRR